MTTTIHNQGEFDAWHASLANKILTGGTIVIKGKCVLTANLRVAGNANLLVNGNANLRVDRTASLRVAGNASVWVYDNANLRVDRTASVWVDGKPIASGPEADANLRRIAPLALAEAALQMDVVHACETRHCMSGWACHALPGGKELEKKHGWYTAGLALLGVEAAGHFYDSDDDAREFLQKYVD